MGLRVDQHTIGVGLGRRGQLGLTAPGQVLLHHGRSVSPQGRDQVDRFAVGREVERLEGQAILRASLDPGTKVGRGIVADADHSPARACRRLGRPYLQLGVCHPAHYVAGIGGIQYQRARVEVEPVDVEQGSIAQVQRDQDRVREVRVNGRRLRPYPLKRRQVANVSRGQVDPKEVEILVAVAVLQVDQHLAVLGPEELANPPLRVCRHDFVVVLANGLDPDLEDVLLVGSDPRKAGSVGGNVGTDLLRVPEQDVARNQRRQLGSTGHGGPQGGRDSEGEQPQAAGPTWCVFSNPHHRRSSFCWRIPISAGSGCPSSWQDHAARGQAILAIRSSVRASIYCGSRSKPRWFEPRTRACWVRRYSAEPSLLNT